MVEATEGDWNKASTTGWDGAAPGAPRGPPSEGRFSKRCKHHPFYKTTRPLARRIPLPRSRRTRLRLRRHSTTGFKVQYLGYARLLPHLERLPQVALAPLRQRSPLPSSLPTPLPNAHCPANPYPSRSGTQRHICCNLRPPSSRTWNSAVKFHLDTATQRFAQSILPTTGTFDICDSTVLAQCCGETTSIGAGISLSSFPLTSSPTLPAVPPKVSLPPAYSITR